MKIRRSVLEKIVNEELGRYLGRLIEADEDKKDDKPAPGVSDANFDGKSKEKKDQKTATKPQDDVDNTAGGSKGKKTPSAPMPPPSKGAPQKPGKELPVADEPEVDAELEKDVATDDEAEDAADVTGGKIASVITGKTVQSITMEPKSKIMPGAQEIVVTFNQITDPLRILIGKTGQVKFYFKGLHNEL